MLFGQPVPQGGFPASSPTAPAASSSPPPAPAPRPLLFGQQVPAGGFGQPQQRATGLGAAAPAGRVQFGTALQRPRDATPPFGVQSADGDPSRQQQQQRPRERIPPPTFGGQPGADRGSSRQQQQQRAGKRNAQGTAPQNGEQPHSTRPSLHDEHSGGEGGEPDEEEAARRNARLSRFQAGPSVQEMEADHAVPEKQPPVAAAPRGGSFGASQLDDVDDGPEDGSDFIIGTCDDMCSAEERHERENSGQLHFFERVDPGNPKLTSHDLIVKRHMRNFGTLDLHPSKFRTFGGLHKTMRHLRAIMDWTPNEHPNAQPLTIHEFLANRYRAARKEFNTQRFDQSPELLPQVMAWNEEVARFHIASSHELINTKGFSAFLNQQEMIKTIVDLLGNYRTSVDLGLPTPNSAEFKCYMVLMTHFGLLNKSGNKLPNQVEAQDILRSFTDAEKANGWFQVTLVILSVLANLDVRWYIQLAKAAPYPLACVMFAHYWDLKEVGFKIAPAAYDSTKDPDNLVSTAALAPIFDLTTNGIKGKCRNMGAEVMTLPGDPSNAAIRFPRPDTLTYAPSKKQVQPWITNKGGARVGTPSRAIVNPPVLSQAFMDLIARYQGKPPGSYPPTLPPPPGAPLPSAPSPKPKPTTPTSLLPTRQNPLQQQAAAPLEPLFGATTNPPSFAPQASPPHPAPPSLTPTQPPPPTALPTTQPLFPPSPTQPPPLTTATTSSPAVPSPGAQQCFNVTGPTVPGTSPSSQEPANAAASSFGTTPWGSATGEKGAAAAAPSAASVAAMAQAQAAAEAAILQARAQEAQSREAQETLQRQVQAQLQLQQQHAAHVQQQHMSQLEELQRSAWRHTEALQQQVAMQSAQLQALVQQRQQAEAELHKRRVRELGDKLRAGLERGIWLRVVQKWHSQTQALKELETQMQGQLARCRIDKVTWGTPSPALRLPQRTLGFSPDASHPPSQSVKRRRHEGDLLSSPYLEQALRPSTPTAALAHPTPLTSLQSHLPLPSIVLPELCAALTRAAAAEKASRNAAAAQASGAAKFGNLQPTGPQTSLQLAQQHQVQQRARMTPLFWKLVLSTGVPSSDWRMPTATQAVSPHQHAQIGGMSHQSSAPPISSMQVGAAAWLRSKLACGRNIDSARPSSDALLSILHVPLDPDDDLGRAASISVPSHATLSIKDLDPLTSPTPDPPSLPRYSSSSMAATAGILLLASGPPPYSSPLHLQPNQGSTGHTAPRQMRLCASGMQSLGSGLQAEMSRAWENLAQLLVGLAPGVQVPLVVLALTDTEGVAAVQSHLESTAGRWPPDLTSRIASCTIVPLLPQAQAESALTHGLRVLAAQPPSPLICASSCSGSFLHSATTPARAFSSSSSSSSSSGGAGPAWGAPQLVRVESVVRDVLEACLEREQAGGHSSAQDTIHAFNEGLAVLAHGVHATATCSMATWGLPPPEIAPSPNLGAPLCWQQVSVAAAAQELLYAQVPADQIHTSLAATTLHVRFTQWASLRTGPSHCLLLPPYLASAAPLPSLPGAIASAAVSVPASSFLARSPGGFMASPASGPSLQASESRYSVQHTLSPRLRQTPPQASLQQQQQQQQALLQGQSNVSPLSNGHRAAGTSPLGHPLLYTTPEVAQRSVPGVQSSFSASWDATPAPAKGLVDATYTPDSQHTAQQVDGQQHHSSGPPVSTAIKSRAHHIIRQLEQLVNGMPPAGSPVGTRLP